MAVLIIPSAFAVHDQSTGLQLDGDVSHACPASPDTGFCAPTQQDWADLFTVSHDSTAHTETVAPNTSVIGSTGTDPDFTKATFTRDFESGPSCALNYWNSPASGPFCTGDDTTFATGSKDTLDITGGGWQCNHDNNVNSKIDIMNAYAASYTLTADDGNLQKGDKVLYFAMEKNKNNGTNDVGFWFLQGDANCSAPTGHQNWQGSAHHVGDVLVVSEFTSGGGVSSIFAYKWVGGSNPLVQIAATSGGASDCKTAGAGDTICATTNSGAKQFNGNITTPWLTSDATLGVGHTVVPPNFFEGGIDITQAFRASGGGAAPSCFNTFVGDTRSSTSLTATLFDYARGKLGECQTTLTTNHGLSNPSNNGESASPTSIGTGVVQSGTDTATLNITGTSTWSGTLSWYLCGPFTSDPNPQSTGCPETLDSNGNPIGNHGVLVNSPSGTAVGSSDGSNAYISPQAYLTAAGWYCWHAHFEPDSTTAAAGVAPGDDDGSNECFQVLPVTPSLTTDATCTSNPCVLSVDTLSDSATLSGTATEPGSGGPGGDSGLYKSIYLSAPSGLSGADTTNSLTWTLYKVSCSGSTTTPSGSPITPHGDNTYGPVTYKPSLSDGVGDYTFVANYSGDSPNTNAAPTATCADPHPASGKTETITLIGSATSSSKQGWLPNDRITLGSSPTGLTLSGNLTVTLYYGALASGATLANCSLAPGAVQEYRETWSSAAGADHPAISGTSPVTVYTHNSTFYVGVDPSTGNPTLPAGANTDATNSYLWLIQYSGTGLTNPADRCEKTVISLDNG